MSEQTVIKPQQVAPIDIFVPTCLRDLEQAALLFQSLDTYVDTGAVASLNLAAIDSSESFPFIQATPTHKFQPCTNYLRTQDLGFGEPTGQKWLLQQAAKLAFARHSTTEFYMVLDSKNMALRPIYITDLVREGRSGWVLEDVTMHKDWWRGSAWALSHKKFNMKPGRQVLSAATPVIFHRASVVEMLDWIEQYHGESIENFFMKRRPIRRRILRMQHTEFMMYYTFLDREGLQDRYHFVSDRLQDASYIWSHQSPEVVAARLKQVLGSKTTGLFTGFHRSLWQQFTATEKEMIQMLATGNIPGVSGSV
jgi:Family of unknown function (DUF6492)